MFENQEVEFKKIWKDDWLEWICGFANTTGGIMYIGADDNGNIIGLGNLAQDLFDKLPGKIKDSLGIITEIELKSNNNLEYITIKIDKYPVPISYHGKFYLRMGRSNHEATPSEYDRLVMERFGKTWDTMPVPNVSINDLDKESIKRFKELAVENKRLTPEFVDVDDKTLLEKLNLYENGYLTTSAILLFHQDPDKYISGAYTRIAFFGKSDADIKYQDEIYGSLITQAEKIVELVYFKYLKALIYFKGMQRIDEYIIPQNAFREIIYNALQHKDYNSHIPIQIKIYDDYINVWNCGEIPKEIENKVYSAHPSMPRNEKISQAFFRAGFVESWGTGTQRIEEYCKNYEVPIPEIVNEFNGVSVKCKPSENYLKVLHDHREPVNGPVNELVNLSKDEKNIISLIIKNNKITQDEISKKLVLSKSTIKRNIIKLKEKGVLERIGADKNGYWQVLKY